MIETVVGISGTPEGNLAIDIITVGAEICIVLVLLWVLKDLRGTRQSLYRRIDGVQKNLDKHEKECAERWGKISTKLEID